MNAEGFLILVIFGVTILFVMAAIEAGYRLGVRAHRRSKDEKASPISSISGALLGLLAFILAFTFGIVTNRFDARKSLVREEANAIGTAWLRSDFLPEPDRREAATLLRDYVTDRLAATQSKDPFFRSKILIDSDRIQRRLWDMAMANALRDTHSEVAALYLESLNAVFDIHALRVVVGLQTRTPGGIWAVLYALAVLGMGSIGYQTAIAESSRSHVAPILAFAFSLLIALIIALDRPQSGFITISQKPLETVRDSITAALEAGSAGEAK